MFKNRGSHGGCAGTRFHVSRRNVTVLDSWLGSLSDGTRSPGVYEVFFSNWDLILLFLADSQIPIVSSFACASYLYFTVWDLFMKRTIVNYSTNEIK